MNNYAWHTNTHTAIQSNTQQIDQLNNNPQHQSKTTLNEHDDSLQKNVRNWKCFLLEKSSSRPLNKLFNGCLMAWYIPSCLMVLLYSSIHEAAHALAFRCVCKPKQPSQSIQQINSINRSNQIQQILQLQPIQSFQSVISIQQVK